MRRDLAARESVVGEDEAGVLLEAEAGGVDARGGDRARGRIYSGEMRHGARAAAHGIGDEQPDEAAAADHMKKSRGEGLGVRG